MARRIRMSEVVAGMTLAQYAQIRARLDLAALRSEPRALAEVLRKAGVDLVHWQDASAGWSKRVGEDEAADPGPPWRDARLPPAIAYRVAYAVAIEEQLGRQPESEALETEVPGSEPPEERSPAAVEEAPRIPRDTLPRPGAPLALSMEGRRDAAAEPSCSRSGPGTSEPRLLPADAPAPRVADPPRPYRPPSPRIPPAPPPLLWPEQAAAAVRSGSARLGRDDETLVGASPPTAAPLPFTPAPAKSPHLAAEGDTLAGVSVAPSQALPFAPAAGNQDAPADGDATLPRCAPVAGSAGERIDADGGTAAGTAAPAAPVLPFKRG